jgi:hypothetical protein
MKKLLNLVLVVPLLGLMSIYIYALLAMIGLKTTGIYNTDPKSVPLGELYKIFLVFPLIGLLGILLGGLILIYGAVNPEKNMLRKNMVITYICGTALTAFLHFFDPGYYQFWFFD